MPPGHLPGEVFREYPTGKRPPVRPRTYWRNYVSWLVWERLGTPPKELDKVAGEREVWALLFRLLPRPKPGYAVDNEQIKMHVILQSLTCAFREKR